MIAAIYARRRTEQNIPEDAKSVTRQIADPRRRRAAPWALVVMIALLLVA